MPLKEEQVIQKFPYRCPYCEEMVSYDSFDLKPGENEIECPSCKRTYIKIVADSLNGVEESSSSKKGQEGNTVDAESGRPRG